MEPEPENPEGFELVVSVRALLKKQKGKVHTKEPSERRTMV